MSRRADCWDNAPTESFFSSLRMELVHDADFATRAQARVALFEPIEVFYNGQRRHSALGYVSRVEYDQSEYPLTSYPLFVGNSKNGLTYGIELRRQWDTFLYCRD
jgi:putative transposase